MTTVREIERVIEAVGVAMRMIKVRFPNMTSEDAYDLASKVVSAVKETLEKGA